MGKITESVREYRQIISWIEEVPLYGKKDGTRNMVRLMEQLSKEEAQDPSVNGGADSKKAPVIHVAGTNGKGSCCAMLSSVLEQSGLKVGLYTSPHLIRYTERIRVNGIEIGEEDFTRLAKRVRAAINELVRQGCNHATFFEILTAIAFLYFRQEAVDVIVLETGVGGRLDATNIIENPLLCLITSISLDHTKVLGDTLEAIAREKAGILRSGCPVVLSKNPTSVQTVIEQIAEEENCPYVYAGNDSCPTDAILLEGDYQQQNLAAVKACLTILQKQCPKWNLTEQVIQEGLRKTRWDGRMQRLTYEETPVLMDGAHNPGGATMLGKYLSKTYPKNSCVLVFSALAKKDVSGILLPLIRSDAVSAVVFTCIDGQDSTQEFIRITEEMSEKRIRSRVVKEPKAALDMASTIRSSKKLEGPVVCAGSLYLIGELLEDIQSSEE